MNALFSMPCCFYETLFNAKKPRNHSTHNRLVAGSSPARPTICIKHLGQPHEGWPFAFPAPGNGTQSRAIHRPDAATLQPVVKNERCLFCDAWSNGVCHYRVLHRRGRRGLRDAGARFAQESARSPAAGEADIPARPEVAVLAAR